VLCRFEATILPGQFLGLKALRRSPFCGDDFGVVTPFDSGDKHFLGDSGVGILFFGEVLSLSL